MVRLALTDGQPLWVNPAHVASVRSAAIRASTSPDPAFDSAHCIITLADGQDAWLVKGTPDDVIASLYQEH